MSGTIGGPPSRAVRLDAIGVFVQVAEAASFRHAATMEAEGVVD
jgi:hypothetical protein